MSPFNSGMNHWQRKWLSDRLHKKSTIEPKVSYQNSQESTQTPRPKSKSLKSEVIPKQKYPRPRPAKIVWPTAEVLEKLLWEKPTSQIAKDLGVSDKAIEKHSKKLSLKKPPRGYWAKKQASDCQ